MKTIQLRVVPDQTECWEKMEKVIKEVYLKEIYRPLLAELGYSSASLKNSRNDLFEALRSGRITFNQGIFSGSFNAKISKELKGLGAKWDRSGKVWKITQNELPMDIRAAIAASLTQFERKVQGIDRILSKIIPEELAAKVKTGSIFDRALYRTDNDLVSSLKAITVTPKLSTEARERLSKEWGVNMQLWITDFTKKEIVSLREDMLKSVLAGNRYEAAANAIKKSYGVTEAKAKFLARQETNLATVKLKEIRYQDAGVNHYKWKSVTGTKLHPVRPMHKALNDRSERGEIFRFDQPPITAPSGARNNPGQDYNCRCTAIPVFIKN